MPATTTYNRGDVVLIAFPFSDGSGVKQRPCVIISHDSYHSNRNEIIVGALTSNYRNLPGYFPLSDYQSAGLPKPTAFTGIIRSILASDIIKVTGKLSDSDMSTLEKTLRAILGL